MTGGTSVKAFPVPPLPTLGELAEGSLVKMNESGAPVEFYVACHNYEQSLNGAGRTLVVRKDCYNDRQWGGTITTNYGESSIDAWLNEEYKIVLDSWIQSLIATTTFCCDLSSGDNTLERAVFLLSATELGETGSAVNVEGSALPIASTLQICYQNGSASTQWTRTNRNLTTAWYLSRAGSTQSEMKTQSHGARPCFTLPSTVLVDEAMNIVA